MIYMQYYGTLRCGILRAVSFTFLLVVSKFSPVNYRFLGTHLFSKYLIEVTRWCENQIHSLLVVFISVLFDLIRLIHKMMSRLTHGCSEIRVDVLSRIESLTIVYF